MYLFFDTETTGLPKFDAGLTDQCQPHIVQLAMLLTDIHGREMVTFKAPIIPEGFTIDETGRAFEVNRVGNDLANTYGISLRQALAMFRMFESKAQLKVAHNYRFDGFLLKSAHARQGMEPISPPIEKFCTMKAMTEIMKLPPTEKMAAAGFDKPKSAKLSEAYEYVTGKKLENAHDALADVRACKDVFFWIKDNGFYIEQPRVGPKESPAITERYVGHLQDNA
jgi:DNA polymerase III subunit epsilon